MSPGEAFVVFGSWIMIFYITASLKYASETIPCIPFTICLSLVPLKFSWEGQVNMYSTKIDMGLFDSFNTVNDWLFEIHS